MKIERLADGKIGTLGEFGIMYDGFNFIRLINHEEFGYEPQHLNDQYKIVTDMRTREEIEKQMKIGWADIPEEYIEGWEDAFKWVLKRDTK